MTNNISITFGPCAVESEQQLMEIAYKGSLIRDIAKPYGIDFKLRGGAWKPRTKLYVTNNGTVETVFEGVGEIGLKWLSSAADKFNLPIVSEVMSEQDIRHFERYLEPERDYLQIGARNSQNFALLYAVGGTQFGVLVKNPQHGVDPAEAQGSLERLQKNRDIVYTMRGQIKYIHPAGIGTSAHNKYMEALLMDPNQHPDSRNLNNIESINLLRDNPFFVDNNISLSYDPSHTFGGKTHLMRRKVGEFTIKAITEYGYDGVIIEVNDKSRYAKCDKDQAMLTTLNGIDWSQTSAEEEPPEEVLPITLVEIVKQTMDHKIKTGHVDISKNQQQEDNRRLDELRWDLTE